MSVLARKRKLSELKFYDNAIRLRRSMIYLLMRDLGAKRGVRDMTDTGKIIRRIPHDTVATQRRKMKALARLVAAGKMEYTDFTRQYLSWRGDKKWYNAHRTVRSMDILYGRLKEWLRQQKAQQVQQSRKTRQESRSLKKSRKSSI